MKTQRVPSPRRLVIFKEPPSCRATLSAIAKPSPEPSMRFCTASGERMKGSKSFFWKSSLMPMPLSSTTTSKTAVCGDEASCSATDTVTEPPAGVNFTAFSTRLLITQ